MGFILLAIFFQFLNDHCQRQVFHFANMVERPITREKLEKAERNSRPYIQAGKGFYWLALFFAFVGLIELVTVRLF